MAHYWAKIIQHIAIDLTYTNKNSKSWRHCFYTHIGNLKYTTTTNFIKQQTISFLFVLNVMLEPKLDFYIVAIPLPQDRDVGMISRQFHLVLIT